jgi:hypothetical protein
LEHEFETDLVFSWPSVAKILGVGVHRARDIVGARGLITERRKGDRAVGVRLAALQSLAKDLGSHDKAPKVESADAICGAIETPERRPNEKMEPPASGSLVEDLDTTNSTSDQTVVPSELAEQLDDQSAQLMQVRGDVDAIRTNVATLADQATQLLLVQNHNGQSIAIIKRVANEDRGTLAAVRAQVEELQRHVAVLEGLARMMPMAMVATGHKCGACGAKALASPVGCGACGFGVGPGPMG